jgi:hypothetical protein
MTAGASERRAAYGCTAVPRHDFETTMPRLRGDLMPCGGHRVSRCSAFQDARAIAAFSRADERRRHSPFERRSPDVVRDVSSQIAGQTGRRPQAAVCGRPIACKQFLGCGWGMWVRCGRVSGLETRPFTAAGLYGDMRIGTIFGYPRSEALRPQCWFSRSSLMTVLPLPIPRPAHIPDVDPAAAPSGGGRRRIPVVLFLAHQLPRYARHAVGQRDRDQHARFLRQHPGSHDPSGAPCVQPSGWWRRPR